MEDDNRRPFHAVNEALEEGRHVGDARSEERASGPKQPDASRGDEEVGDVQRPPERRRRLDAEPVVRVGEAPEGAVAESGRAEPTGGGVHQEVQRGNAAAKAGIVESIPGDDQTRGGPLALHRSKSKAIFFFFFPRWLLALAFSGGANNVADVDWSVIYVFSSSVSSLGRKRLGNRLCTQSV